ncbi:MAG: polyphenol oxidase family protein [Bdellovibrionota bacterium]
MKIVERCLGGLSVWQVDSWLKARIFHGFLGGDLDVKERIGDPELFLPEEACGAANLPVLQLRQVHSADISEASRSESRDLLLHPRTGDGWFAKSLLNADPSAVLGVRTADCFPVLLWGVSGEHLLVAALHCGWRGTVAELLPRAIDALTERGTSRSTIEVAIGPGARGCCYEIGEDVLAQLPTTHGVGDEQELVVRRSGKIFCHLPALLRAQARGCSVEDDRISEVECCTICDPRFFSYRRQKAHSGRQLSFICTSFVC